MDLLDETVTYGGWLLGAIALCGATWLVLRAYPSFDAFVRSIDDDTDLDDTPEGRAHSARWHRVGRITAVIAALAVASLAIGYVIPG